MNALQIDQQETEQIEEKKITPKMEADLFLDPEKNGFHTHSNKILKQVGYKQEEMRTGKKGGVELTEILSEFNGIDTHEALNTLQTTNRTFDLFKKMVGFAFEEVNLNKKAVSINLYIKDISDPRLITEIESLENKYNIDNSKITLEILEYNYGDLNKEALKNIRILKEKGFLLAIDDFIPNIEEDNLSYDNLTKLLSCDIIPEYVKIDGAYMQKVLNKELSNDDIRVLRSIVQFLKKGGVKIVGEWISTNEEGKKAKELGIDLFQGRDLTDDFSTEEPEIKSFRLNTNVKSFSLYKETASNDENFNQEEVRSFRLTSNVKSFTLFQKGGVKNILDFERS